MYTFVFMWTPVLKASEDYVEIISSQSETTAIAAQHDNNLSSEVTEYLGLIFAVHMLAVMVGSSIFKLLSLQQTQQILTSDIVYKIPLFLHGIAFLSSSLTSAYIFNKYIVYSSFLVFQGKFFV